MNEVANNQNHNSFFILFVNEHFFEGNNEYAPLQSMADKLRNPPFPSQRSPKISIREYNRDGFISEPYSYNP